MELRGNDRIKKSSYTVHHNKDKNNSEDASILGATKQSKIRNMPTKRPAPGAKSHLKVSPFPDKTGVDRSEKENSFSSKRARQTQNESSPVTSKYVSKMDAFASIPTPLSQDANRMRDASPARRMEQAPVNQNSSQSSTSPFFGVNCSTSLPPRGDSSETTEPWYIRNRQQETVNSRRVSHSPVPNTHLQHMQMQYRNDLSQTGLSENQGITRQDHQGQPSRQARIGPEKVGTDSTPVQRRDQYQLHHSTHNRSGISAPYASPNCTEERRESTGSFHMPPPAAYVPTPRPSTSKKSAAKSAKSSTCWRHERRLQEKSQERAFTAKKANPFANYKHDPNDAEGFLESLNSANKESSIVPQQELEAINQRRAYQRPLGLIPKKFGRRQGRLRGRNRSLQSQRIPEREYMRMKAEERPMIIQREIFLPSLSRTSQT